MATNRASTTDETADQPAGVMEIDQHSVSANAIEQLPVPEHDSIIDRKSRLGTVEIRRRMWHMSPGILPFLLWCFPHRDPISPTLRNIMVGIVVVLVAWMIPQFDRIRRRGERGGSAAVLGYALSVLITLLLFPAQAELGLTVLGILAFGDGSATLIGLAVSGPPLPWNPSKSWVGTFGFIAAAIPLTTLIYWGETHNPEAQSPGVSLAVALVCVAPAVIVAALCESMNSRINDNLRVGVAAALVLVATHGLVVGF